VWIEGTPRSREIHQTRPRAPFAGATYWRCGENGINGTEKTWKMSRYGGGARGPRIKYHPRYVPFENATSFSILSVFCSFAARRFPFSLSLPLSVSLWVSHLFTFCCVLDASVPECTVREFDGDDGASRSIQRMVASKMQNREIRAAGFEAAAARVAIERYIERCSIRWPVVAIEVSYSRDGRADRHGDSLNCMFLMTKQSASALSASCSIQHFRGPIRDP